MVCMLCDIEEITANNREIRLSSRYVSYVSYVEHEWEIHDRTYRRRCPNPDFDDAAKSKATAIEDGYHVSCYVAVLTIQSFRWSSLM